MYVSTPKTGTTLYYENIYSPITVLDKVVKNFTWSKVKVVVQKSAQAEVKVAQNKTTEIEVEFVANYTWVKKISLPLKFTHT